MDQGKHIPGANRIIMPVPKPLAIPDKQVITAQQASAWHMHRGGSKAADVVLPPVLLTDLVAGWALTAGPQQTLDSTGVIASGALDLTEHGSPSYSSDGISLNGSDQYLSENSVAALQPGSQDYFVYLEVVPDFGASPLSWSLIAKQNYPTDFAIEYMVFLDKIGATYQFHSVMESIDGNFYDTADSAAFTSGQLAARSVIMAWRTGGNLYLQRNVAPPTTSAVTQDYFTSTGPLTVGYDTYNGTFSAMTLRNIRIVIGDVSQWITAKDWLGAGRTDLEIASYTP